jgi:hypothetical protein
MSALTDLSKIQEIARGEPVIQALDDNDEVVTLVLDQVALEVPESVFGRFTELAQRYLAAHLLKMAHNSANADGKLASETVGSVSQSFTLPYFTTKTVLGATQYGMEFLELRNRVIVPARFAPTR